MANQGETLERMFEAAVAAVVPSRCLPSHLPDPQFVKGRIVVVGGGKAGAEMARIAGDHFGAHATGLVVTRYGHDADGPNPEHIEVVEAAHPVPDKAGNEAASRMLDLVSALGPDDLVICLLSGGGSSLLSAPAEGLTLLNKQLVTEALLRSGATISEINCVRKHLSRIKGGRLAVAAAPTPVLTLAISDVPGDDAAVIASGPTVADPSTFADARAILDKYGIHEPEPVIAHLQEATEETPKDGDPRLDNTEYRLIATPASALDAAAAEARAAGYTPVMLGDDLEGESREVARDHARLALDYRDKGEKVAILSGGETTVTMKGSGGGGPNAEYALALAVALDGAKGVSAVACDTDGIDGSETNAGAVINPSTLERARALSLEASDFLDDNDSYGFFLALDDLVLTGPTRTNVNDFRAILVE